MYVNLRSVGSIQVMRRIEYAERDHPSSQIRRTLGSWDTVLPWSGFASSWRVQLIGGQYQKHRSMLRMDSHDVRNSLGLVLMLRCGAVLSWHSSLIVLAMLIGLGEIASGP